MPRAYKNTWDKSKYNYYDLSRKTSRQSLEREYKRMMKESERRLTALSRSKNETAQTVYRQYQDILKMGKKKTLSKNAQVKAVLAMEKFLSTKSSKVTNIYAAERKTLEGLQEAGYDFISKKNLRDFGKFMEAMRAAGYARKGSSSTVMEFLSERGKIGKNTEALKKSFERWLETQ